MLHERGDHVPVAVYLENEGGVFAAGAHDVQEFFCGCGQELAANLGARFPHDSFTAQFVEVQDQFSLLDGISGCGFPFRAHVFQDLTMDSFAKA
jgi:hypothetical protein